jgi:hypothetical protein
MLHSLKPHPVAPRLAVATIDVDIAAQAQRLTLRYRLQGDLSKLQIPATCAPLRTDELWQHTCFEAFIGTAATPVYYEFNWSPSGCWAAYCFTGYRTGMAMATGVAASPISVTATSEQLELHAIIDCTHLAEMPLQATLRVGLSAVLESTQQVKSYWALAHPSATPDFHRADGWLIAIDTL